MKKFVLISFVFLKVLMNGFSQTAVIDVSAIAAAVENGYTLYQQLQSAIESYQKQVELLTQAQKNLASFDPSNYDPTTLDGLLHMVDDYMTQMDNLEKVYKQKNMRIGSTSFSLEELYSTDMWGNILTGKEMDDDMVFKKIGKDVSKKVNPENMTTRDKQNFYRKHGLSVKHYNKLSAASQQLDKKMVEAGAVIPIAYEKNKQNKAILSDMAKNHNEVKGAEAHAQVLDSQMQTLNSTAMIGNDIAIKHLEIAQAEAGVREIEREQAKKDNAMALGEARSDDNYDRIIESSTNDTNLLGPEDFKQKKAAGEDNERKVRVRWGFGI